MKQEVGTIMMETEEAGKRWNQYIGELYDGDRPEIHNTTEGKEGIEIIESEVRWAMKGVNRGKAAGGNGAAIKMLRGVGYLAVNDVTFIANKFYQSRQMTE